MSEETAEYGIAQPKVPEFKRSNFEVAKAQAKKLSIGDAVTITIRGEVCGISAGYGPKDQSGEPYSLEVKYRGLPKIEANAADATVRGLMGSDRAPAGRHKNEADKSLDDVYMGKTRAY